MKVQFNFQKKHLLMALLAAALVVVATIAIAEVPNPGHSYKGVDFEEKLVILDNGNIGIGTPNPTAKLAVNGQINASALGITGNALVGGKLDVNGQINANTLGIAGNAWIGQNLDVSNGEVKAMKFTDDQSGYYADLNAGGNTGGDWLFAGQVCAGGDCSSGTVLNKKIITASPQWGSASYMDIPESTIKQYCSDIDRCKITVASKHAVGGVAEIASGMVYYDPSSRRWLSPEAPYPTTPAINMNGDTEYMLGSETDKCALTDGTNSGDTDDKFGLWVFKPTSQQELSMYTCVLIIED